MNEKDKTNVVYVRSKDTFGMIALIMGIIALIGSWIPYLNVISIIIAISAIIVGICSVIKFIRKKAAVAL